MKHENKHIFLTFDMDWANDDVLRYFHSLICQLDLYGTLHVTHDTPVLAEIRKEGRLELGIHPNFNKLLENTENGRLGFRTKVQKLMEIVPEAVCARSHSLVSGSPISKCFAENGLKYESNLLCFPGGGRNMKCYKDIWGMVQVPIIFEDDVYLLSKAGYQAGQYLGHSFESALVFNFHPIHIFLNTDKIECYENAKRYTKNYSLLKQFINKEHYGIKDLFEELVYLAKEKEYRFCRLSEMDVF